MYLLKNVKYYIYLNKILNYIQLIFHIYPTYNIADIIYIQTKVYYYMDNISYISLKIIPNNIYPNKF